MEADAAPASSQGPTARVKRQKSKRLSKPKSNSSMSTDGDTIRAAEVTGTTDSDDEFQEFFDADHSKGLERHLGSDDGSYFDAIHADVTEQVDSSDDDDGDIDGTEESIAALDLLSDKPDEGAEPANMAATSAHDDRETWDDDTEESLQPSPSGEATIAHDDTAILDEEALMDALAGPPADHAADDSTQPDNDVSLDGEPDTLFDSDSDELPDLETKDDAGDVENEKGQAEAVDGLNMVAATPSDGPEATPPLGGTDEAAPSGDFVDVPSVQDTASDDSFTSVNNEDLTNEHSAAELAQLDADTDIAGVDGGVDFDTADDRPALDVADAQEDIAVNAVDAIPLQEDAHSSDDVAAYQRDQDAPPVAEAQPDSLAEDHVDGEEATREEVPVNAPAADKTSSEEDALPETVTEEPTSLLDRSEGDHDIAQSSDGPLGVEEVVGAEQSFTDSPTLDDVAVVPDDAVSSAELTESAIDTDFSASEEPVAVPSDDQGAIVDQEGGDTSITDSGADNVDAKVTATISEPPVQDDISTYDDHDDSIDGIKSNAINADTPVSEDNSPVLLPTGEVDAPSDHLDALEIVDGHGSVVPESSDALSAFDEPPAIPPPTDAVSPPAPPTNIAVAGGVAVSGLYGQVVETLPPLGEMPPDNHVAPTAAVETPAEADEEGSRLNPFDDSVASSPAPSPTLAGERRVSTNPFDPLGTFEDESPPLGGDATPQQPPESDDTAWESVPTFAAQRPSSPAAAATDSPPADAAATAVTTPVVFNPSDFHDDDSESDEDVAVPAPLGLRKKGPAATDYSDDEEELEVNADLAQTVRAPVVAGTVVAGVAVAATSLSSNPLADALSLAIASTTQAPNCFDSPAASPVRAESPTQRDSLLGSSSDNSSFGISYQKMSRKAPSSKASYGIGDGDSNDVILPVHSAKDAAHADEFDDVDFDAAPAAAPVVELDKLQKIRLAKEAEKEAKVLAQIQEATKAERLALIREQQAASETSGPPNGGVAGAAVATDKAALAELHDMYKRGLGDQEVAALQEGPSAAIGGASTLVPTNVHATITQAIAEDEEEDDDKEDEDSAGGKAGPRATPAGAESEAAAAWENVETFQHEKATARSKDGKAKGEAFRWIHFKEAQVHFREADYVHHHMDAIVVEDEDAAAPSGCLSCFRPATLSFASAFEQRDLVFCIAMCQLDHREAVHYRILQTIYQKMTNSRGECPLSGGHWEIIGFQGNDPSTDLRGGGMLSLLQMLFLLDSYPDLVGKLFAASRHETYHFPLACVLINLTVQTLGAMRQGRLTALCNKEKDVMTAMNKLYAAMGVRLVADWKTKQGAVEFPLILKEVVDEATSMPLRAVAEAESALAMARGSDAAGVGDADFTDLNDK